MILMIRWPWGLLMVICLWRKVVDPKQPFLKTWTVPFFFLKICLILIFRPLHQIPSRSTCFFTPSECWISLEKTTLHSLYSLLHVLKISFKKLLPLPNTTSRCSSPKSWWISLPSCSESPLLKTQWDSFLSCASRQKIFHGYICFGWPSIPQLFFPCHFPIP